MRLDVSLFYDETSEVCRFLKDLMRQLQKATEYEHQHNPEVFNLDSVSFHSEIVSNEEMEKLYVEFVNDRTNHPKIAYSVFLVGEFAMTDPSYFKNLGHTDYLDLIKREYELVVMDNKAIAATVLSKRPWLIYEKIQYVLDKIGVVIED